MKKWMIILIVIVAIVLVGIFSLGGVYNGLVSGRETVKSSLSTIDVQLQRRNDLIPNLVNSVKGYASHETDAINSVTAARAKMMSAQSAQSPGEVAAADAQLTGALSRLLLIVENYPNLKADVNFRQLSDELAGTENRISVARQDYNNVAKDFNIRIQRFPRNIIAGMMGFEQSPYFGAQEADKAAPKVDFSKG